ncbi:endonuclease/exonuclease/phosphatase family protein [Chitinophaga pendula]|uniref:endonuclease/exonuclease/phosphatase family protein n=1 Tax=Chitinophaga TaxID=79328 RepID=UPI000BAFDE1F|nr:MULTISPECIES: endonuclease/exonuclease/phosphatase family protein [Chitinophaga]ASZ14358.1 endonuclease [Chitinophaga sp. MD30]UCJ07993.1 endonuclease/exonuclease/phosphatase family protein [Chitinophaga pendula]
MKRCLQFLTISSLLLTVFSVHAQHLKVLTYNIHHGENMKGQVDIQGIANVILATNPDLVALQEVDSVTNRTHKSDQLKELAAITGMYTYFAKAMDYDGGGYGNGILSRLPIKSSYTLPLPGTAGNEPRVAGVITLQLPGDSLLQFIATHLDASNNSNDRIEQVKALLQYCQKSKNNTILAGDLNAIPASKEMALLRSVFADATQILGHTHPADTPTVKLDYIWLHPAHRWTVIAPKVIEETVASDHRPVVCELDIKSTLP